MLKCDYIYKPKNEFDVEMSCGFCAKEDEIKIYETVSGNFCRFHLPVDDKNRILEEHGKARELQILKDEVEGMIMQGKSFYGLQMHDELSIADAKIKGVYFIDSVFSKDVKFEKTEIPYADFSHSHFKSNLDCNGSKITNFRSVSTSFDGYVNFGDAVVYEWATFENSVFNNFARFKKTEFRAAVNFNGVTFNDYANFKSVIFAQQEPLHKTDGTEVTFNSCVFKERVDFRDAWFSIDLHMKNTLFENREHYTSFANVRFGKIVNFKGAIFNEFADFGIDANQEDESKKLFRSCFEDVLFKRGVAFNNRKFCSSTNFTKAEFYEDTQFFNVEFNENTDIYYARFHELDSKSASRTYQILKTKMSEVFLRNEAIKFHVLEQRAMRRQKNTPIFYKLVSVLDDVTTGCGYNATRSFITLVLLPFVFALIYGLVFPFVDIGTDIGAFEFSVDQIINPYDVLEKDSRLIVSSMQGSYAILIKVIATIQSSLTIVFTALFLTTLKRQYNPL